MKKTSDFGLVGLKKMKGKIPSFLFVIAMLICSTYLLFSEEKCDECKQDPAKCCDFNPEICSPSSPGNDHPDDNYSLSNFSVPSLLNGVGSSSVFSYGYWIFADNLLSSFCDNVNNVDLYGSKWSDNLVIPSGGLFGKAGNTEFKAIISNYVNKGGTLIVFSQQFGSEISSLIPFPADEKLVAFGWREDQSCLKNSVFFSDMHPVLSSSTNQLTDVGVDGYFSVFPANSTVLLRRRSNLEPALLFYKYGNGTVILTSMFTDWAFAHSQASVNEIKIFRDLITFAKNPDLPVPMFNLAENPAPSIQLNASIENYSKFPAVMAKRPDCGFDQAFHYLSLLPSNVYIVLSCNAAGISVERDVSIPVNQSALISSFQVPFQQREGNCQYAVDINVSPLAGYVFFC